MALDSENPIAESVIREKGRASQERSTFEQHWLEIAERVLPGWADSFRENTGSNNQFNRGEKGTEKIFDSTASMGLERFASIMDSMLTPRNQTWHKLKADDSALNKNRNTKLWFDEVTRLLFKYRYSPKANFSGQNQLSYQSLGAFGSQAMFIDDLDGQQFGLRYKACNLGQTYFFENHQGMIDMVIRSFQLTARQAAQKWGVDKLPEVIAKAAKNEGKTAEKGANPHTYFDFVHCVKPREDYDPERADYKGMPFVSYYVAEKDKVLLSEGGYQTFPFAASRYNQAPGEVYGRSPAMLVLPAIKTLNEEKKTVLKQGHRTVDPIILGHDDGVLDTFSLRPGTTVAGGVSSEGRALVQPFPVGNIAVGKDLMDDERSVINDAFLVTLFQILIETPSMTATEVIERTREKGILLAPTVGRQQSEYLGPMIERELDVLARQGALPPMPKMLQEAGGEYSVEYDSPLSRMQRAEEASGAMRSLEQVLAIVDRTQDPGPLDNFDLDLISRETSEIAGMPTRWLRAEDQVSQIRQGRQEQADEQTAIQAAPGGAALMKAQAAADKERKNNG